METKRSGGIRIDRNSLPGILLFATALVLLANQLTIQNLQGTVAQLGVPVAVAADGDTKDIIPRGMPPIYGAELGVSYDDISAADPQKSDATIRKLGLQDVNIELSGEQLQRYISIASQISCEYCCGAKSVIFENGQPACGCAHSYAMRGVAKYLITKHGDEFSDAQVLEEIGKWKVLFFPDIHKQKAQALQQKGIELNYINLASNKYRGIETAAGGEMVGGC